MDEMSARPMTPTTMPMMPPHTAPRPNQQVTNHLPDATPPHVTFDLEAILQQVSKNTAKMDQCMAGVLALPPMMTLPMMPPHSAP